MRKFKNILVAASFFLLLVVMLAASAFAFIKLQSYNKEKASMQVEEVEAYEIIINDELRLYVGQSTVINPYLMSIDGSIKSAEFKYESSNEDVLSVDKKGNISVKQKAGDGEKLTITIKEPKTRVEKSVAVKVISSLEKVLSVKTSDGTVIEKAGVQEYIMGEAYTLSVVTEPQEISIANLCQVTAYDSEGKEVDVFEVSVSEDNRITVTPTGIGVGYINVKVNGEDGSTLYSKKMDFSISMANKYLSDEILKSAGMTLMQEADFAKVTKITIDENINVTNLDTLKILPNLKDLYIDMATTLYSPTNINESYNYYVPYDDYTSYCNNYNWSSHTDLLTPYDKYDANARYIIYHCSETGYFQLMKVDSYLTSFPDRNGYTSKIGYTHTGWATKSGTPVTVNSVKNSSESMHLYSVWSPIEYKVVYHVRNTSDGNEKTIYETWKYDETKSFKKIADFGVKLGVGYTFLGWSTSSGSNLTQYDVNYKDGENQINLRSYNGDEIHLYDVWEIVIYTIELRDKDGNFLSSIPNLRCGDDYELPEVTDIPTGHVFEGWKTEDGKTVLQPGKNTEILAKENGEVVVLTASVVETTYAVRLVLAGDKDKTPVIVVDENGEEISYKAVNMLKYTEEFPLPKLKREGYSSYVWECLETGVQYSATDIISMLTEESNIMYTFVAVWSK